MHPDYVFKWLAERHRLSPYLFAQAVARNITQTLRSSVRATHATPAMQCPEQHGCAASDGLYQTRLEPLLGTHCSLINTWTGQLTKWAHAVLRRGSVSEAPTEDTGRDLVRLRRVYLPTVAQASLSSSCVLFVVFRQTACSGDH